jgi:DNA topoisomerase-2
VTAEVEEDNLREGEIPAKEYDYLLTMQILSLTEERVIELQKQMSEKSMEYDQLKAMHISHLWKRDLQAFLIELEKYEEQEERDRLAHTANAENKGKGKGVRKAIPKGAKPTAAPPKKAT